VKRARGFTLLEIMLAFALLAAGIGLLLGIQSGGLRQVRTSAEVGEASLHAQSLLDSLGVVEPLRAGTNAGEFDGGRYRWRLEITEIEEAEAAEVDAEAVPVAPGPVPEIGPALASASAPRLYRVVLDIAWGSEGDGRQLRYVTLRTRYPAALETAR
jgi:general secretion pathway protein I